MLSALERQLIIELAYKQANLDLVDFKTVGNYYGTRAEHGLRNLPRNVARGAEKLNTFSTMPTFTRTALKVSKAAPKIAPGVGKVIAGTGGLMEKFKPVLNQVLT